MKSKYKMLINDQLVSSSNQKYFWSINPYTEEGWAQIPLATEEDVRLAVHSAHNAYKGSWSKVNGLGRAEILHKLADLLVENVDELARIETIDNGKVIRETKSQILFAARQYRFFAGYADKLYGDVIPLDNMNLFNYTVQEPIGVVSLIISWNSPIYSLANKLAPALAAGNTVIIKPSEHASAAILEFGKLIQTIGLPEGVVNIVSGDGKVGEALSNHPLVNKISFTGGPDTGSMIAKSASKNLIPTTLELGGKSPNIIFEDADIDRAIIGAVAGIFGASGQSCIAGSRLLVQRSIYEQVINGLVERTKNINLGDPLDSRTEMGPIANEKQYNHINSLIDIGKKEGAHLVNEEWINEHHFERGFFIPPTIFKDVDNKMVIAQKEFFGPVLCIIPFENEEQAIDIANDTEYGLASGIWTRDISKAHRVARKIEAGTVWVNTYRSTAAQAPFGGYKKSGYGKERGWHALLEYTNVKNIMVDLSDSSRDPFSMNN